MVDLAELLHEISVAFADSANLRTLLPRIATGISRHVSLVEAEVILLHRNGGEVEIAAFAPESGRRWEGQRSARFLHQRAIEGARWCEELELVRVSTATVACQLKLAVGHAGILTLSFSTDISRDLGKRGTDILVSSLLGHCRRLGQLDATARCSYHAHRYLAEPSEPAHTEVSVPSPSPALTDIPVESLDVALIDCISAALSATRGRIYGDSGAAKLLGLKPSTLQSKMRKLGIERGRFVA